MEIIEHPEFSQLTTLGLGGRAKVLCKIDSYQDLDGLAHLIEQYALPTLVLGRGSNLLACDGELDLLLIKPNIQDAPKIIYEDSEVAHVTVGAGVCLAKLLKFCADHGLAGLEGLVGIPGSVGGAISMNAGSFGSETCVNLLTVTVWNSGEILTVPAQQITYGYRQFMLPTVGSFFLVVNGTFGLQKKDCASILKTMAANLKTKQAHQPLKVRSAGCVFKNPAHDLSAGFLLEACGLKGQRLGGVEFSTVHANFLVNVEQGTSTQALELIDTAKMRVFEQFKIKLEPEVRIIMCPQV